MGRTKTTDGAARKPGRPKREVTAVTNVNPDDIAACYTDYASMRGDIARIGQRIAVSFARFEKLGVQSKGIKRAYALAQKDPDVVAAQVRMETEYLAILEIIDFSETGQGSFAAGLKAVVAKPSPVAAERLNLARAHADGYNTGLAGGDKGACRVPPGTEAHVKWLEGWHDGHADRVARKPDAEKTKPASTSRARRAPSVEQDVAAAAH